MSAAPDTWSLDTLLAPWTEQALPSVALAGVSLDSRWVTAGDLYLAVAGATTHGMHFAEQAVDAGAVAVLTSDNLPVLYDAIKSDLQRRGIPVVCIRQLDDLCGLIAARFYKDPDKNLTLIAVTGTDGKTSVCRFIAQAMSENGRLCGYIGTLGWGVGERLEATALTTPDAVMLRRLLAGMQDQGARCVAIEASSHGIAEGRLDGLAIDVAVLTNLGRDHLDYHITVEAYRAAKERLFHWPSLQAVILNADDAMGRDLLKQIRHVPCIAYSTNAGSVAPESQLIEARNIVTHDAGLAFDLIEESFNAQVSIGLLGRFNIDNLLACYASLRACDVAANEAFHSLHAVTPVAGRMERHGGGDKPTVVIDFSHTPGALQVAINAVRVHCRASLWVVFGCGGDRDRGKRAPMAKAAQVAEHVVLTDDNPRTESSDAIIRDAMAGFDDPEKVVVIPDRAAAIRFAVTQAVSGDLVLIAGKGHEDYQIVGTQKHHFSDREQALAALESDS